MEDMLYTITIKELIQVEAAWRAEGEESFADMVAEIIAERTAA